MLPPAVPFKTRIIIFLEFLNILVFPHFCSWYFLCLTEVPKSSSWDDSTFAFIAGKYLRHFPAEFKIELPQSNFWLTAQLWSKRSFSPTAVTRILTSSVSEARGTNYGGWVTVSVSSWQLCMKQALTTSWPTSQRGCCYQKALPGVKNLRSVIPKSFGSYVEMSISSTLICSSLKDTLLCTFFKINNVEKYMCMYVCVCVCVYIYIYLMCVI